MKYCEICKCAIPEANGTRRKYCKPCAKKVHYIQEKKRNVSINQKSGVYKVSSVDEGYMMLAAAIVGTTVKNYRSALLNFHNHETRANADTVCELEKDLRSKYFGILLQGLDAEDIISRIRMQCNVSDKKVAGLVHKLEMEDK